jgi:hypothetical protein
MTRTGRWFRWDARTLTKASPSSLSSFSSLATCDAISRSSAASSGILCASARTSAVQERPRR